MTFIPSRPLLCTVLICAGLASCGPTGQQVTEVPLAGDDPVPDSTLWDLFQNVDDPNVTLEVNRYLWTAALEVLDFMPVEASDPFSGVIVMGYGTPPGGSRAYRATVYVQDPALDARSLNLALSSRSGPASPETVRAVEDAILTHARMLRIRDQNL